MAIRGMIALHADENIQKRLSHSVIYELKFSRNVQLLWKNRQKKTTQNYHPQVEFSFNPISFKFGILFKIFLKSYFIFYEYSKRS